jgi:AraC family transcriptional regulator
MPDLVQMTAHGSATPSPTSGRVVVSRLPAGESQILSLAPAIKMVLAGEEIHELDGRPFPLRPGQLLLVDRGDRYRAIVRRNSQTVGMCIYLPRAATGGDLFQPASARGIFLSADATELGQSMKRLAAQLHAADPHTAQVSAIVRQAGHLLLRALGDRSSAMAHLAAQKASTRQNIMNRLEIARAHLHNEAERYIALHELAVVAGMSSFQFTRYFSAVFGSPPARYHRSLRLNHARDRLRKGGASVTDVAMSSGYSELSAFSSAYRREFGCAPSMT